MRIQTLIVIAAMTVFAGCGGSTTPPPPPSGAGGQPAVTLNTLAAGAAQLSGYAYNVDPSQVKVVIYVLTNQWYVQPFVDAPFTDIASDGSWISSTNPLQSIVVLLVNPADYTPAATKITNPALDSGVLAWTEYPPGQVSVSFSGRTWGIKVTGNAESDQFDPGPNFWSNDPSVVSVASVGLHLKITQIQWQLAVRRSLSFGIAWLRHVHGPGELAP